MTERKKLTGPYGEAELMAVPETRKAGLVWWLITAPLAHPVWSQYLLSVITLADRPDQAPAYLHFPGATHELMVVALNPGVPPQRYTAESLESGATINYLEPLNVVEQFTATDDEMRELAELACGGVVNGRLNPETADAPERIREHWLTACVRTLAHMRGEEHAP